jgi:hypothetical protein
MRPAEEATLARPRHPRKELEGLLRDAEEQGWRVVKDRLYFKLKCPCAAKHFTTVHLTPSNPRYQLNKRKWLVRRTCWEEKR